MLSLQTHQEPGLFDMALKNLKSPNLGFLGF